VAGETIVFYPKYTSLVSGTYFSDPYDVTGYKQVDTEVLLVGAVGTSPVVTALLQESSDLITWTDISTATTLTAGTVSVLSKTSPARYIRLRIIVSGTNPVGTLWAKAVARDA